MPPGVQSQAPPASCAGRTPFAPTDRGEMDEMPPITPPACGHLPRQPDLETVLLAGAVPVFADIDETLCRHPRAVAAAITPKTKAVLVVHMCGAMARIDALSDLCRAQRLLLIEDVAQAAGASFRGKSLGP